MKISDLNQTVAEKQMMDKVARKIRSFTDDVPPGTTIAFIPCVHSFWQVVIGDEVSKKIGVDSVLKKYTYNNGFQVCKCRTSDPEMVALSVIGNLKKKEN